MPAVPPRPGSRSRRGGGGLAEDPLPGLDEGKVGHDHAGQGGEESAGQRLEAEGGGQRRGRKQRADRGDAEGGEGQRQAGVAAEERARLAAANRSIWKGSEL
jgi:hypothetical protein